jgi:hypothetical protein
MEERIKSRRPRQEVGERRQLKKLPIIGAFDVSRVTSLQNRVAPAVHWRFIRMGNSPFD